MEICSKLCRPVTEALSRGTSAWSSASRRLKRVLGRPLGTFFCGIALVCGMKAQAPAISPPTPRAKDFPKEVAKSFAALFSAANLRPLVFGSIATGAAVIPEQNVETYFRDHPEGLESVTEFGEIMGNGLVVSPIVGGLFIAGRLGGDQRFQSMTYSLAEGLLINGAVTASIKHGVGRTRPNGADDLSFPSGHTSTSFMWATVLSRTYGPKAGIPAYIAASYVGATRLEENAHHLTDVVAGAAIGYLVGRTVTRRKRTDREPRVTWNVAPTRGGFAASLSFRGP